MVAAPPPEKKLLFRKRLLTLGLFAAVVRYLASEPDVARSGEDVKQFIAERLPGSAPADLFRTLVGWGRYGQLFHYDAQATSSRCTPDATRTTDGREAARRFAASALVLAARAVRVGIAAAALVLTAALSRGQTPLPIMASPADPSGAAPDSAAAPPAEKRFDAHFQFTSVTQYHPDFTAPYSGQNSMDPEAEHETTVTATLFLGVRLWKDAELYVNPEMSGGKGLSSTFGIAGFPNGDAFRVGSPEPHIYLARADAQATFPLEGETEPVEDDPNQLGGTRPVRRWTVTVGQFGLSDFFDANPYSGDARSQFMNWAAWTAGAWDYAADTRGYTYGFVIERFDADWAARFAGAAEPLVANGEQLDKDLLHAYSLTAEYERGYKLDGKAGNGAPARLLQPRQHGQLRRGDRAGRGDRRGPRHRRDAAGRAGQVGIHRQRGPFARRSVGRLLPRELERRSERSRGPTPKSSGRCPPASCGRGRSPRRPNDEAGLALIVNGLCAGHREYLALGGYGFMIGDGRLDYGLETIAEIFYQAALIEHLWFAADYQFVANPAYNRDRGPINVLGARLHVEF